MAGRKGSERKGKEKGKRDEACSCVESMFSVLRDKTSVPLLPVLCLLTVLLVLPSYLEADMPVTSSPWPWKASSTRRADQPPQASVMEMTGWKRPESCSQRGGCSCQSRLSAMRRRAKGAWAWRQCRPVRWQEQRRSQRRTDSAQGASSVSRNA
jgi:hypothetical protein